MATLAPQQRATIKEALSYLKHHIQQFDYTYGHYTPEVAKQAYEMRQRRLKEIEDASEALQEAE